MAGTGRLQYSFAFIVLLGLVFLSIVHEATMARPLGDINLGLHADHDEELKVVMKSSIMRSSKNNNNVEARDDHIYHHHQPYDFFPSQMQVDNSGPSNGGEGHIETRQNFFPNEMVLDSSGPSRGGEGH